MAGQTPLGIELWRTTRTDQADLDAAVETLEGTLAPQLDWEVEVGTNDPIELPEAPFDSYQAYLDAFEDAIDPVEGVINVCLYHYFVTGGIDEAIELGFEKIDELLGDAVPDDVLLACGMDPDETGTEAAPWVGYADSALTPDAATLVVVNGAWRGVPFVDEALVENTLIHEVLHPVLDDSRAPDGHDDHSYGTNVGGANTPMLTAYAESLSPNRPPDRTCEQPDGPREVNEHTTELSSCSKAEVPQYLAETFGND